MSDENNNALAIVRENRPAWSNEQRQLIRNTFANGASDSEFAALLAVAEARDLNPFTKQVFFVKRWDSQKRCETWAVQVSIDGLRAIAERTGLYAGQDEPEYLHDDNGAIVLCKVRVYRKDWGDRACVGVAYWSEYVQTTKEGRPNAMWSKFAHVMIAKCAEALALRKAFPEVASGLYTPDEIDNGRTTPVNVEVVTEDPVQSQTVEEWRAFVTNAKSKRELDDVRTAMPVDYRHALRPDIFRANCRLVDSLEDLEKLKPMLGKLTTADMLAQCIAAYDARRAELEGPKDDGPKGSKRKPPVKSADATGSANETTSDLSNPATALAVLRRCKAPQHAVAHYAKHHAHKPLNQREVLRNALVSMLWQRWPGAVPTRDDAERMVADSEATSAVRVAA